MQRVALRTTIARRTYGCAHWTRRSTALEHAKLADSWIRLIV